MNEPPARDLGSVGSHSVPPDRGAPAAQPRWHRDFPIDWADDDYISRRELVKFVVLTSGAFVVGQLWILARGLLRRDHPAPQARAVARVDELPIGGAKTFSYPESGTTRLLVRTGPRAFVAYDQRCTHLQCPVVPAVEQGKLHCPCHNGWFDLQTGEPTAGPPQRRLPRVELELRGDEVYAVGVEEVTT
jgi:Rieske Fe-S protein